MPRRILEESLWPTSAPRVAPGSDDDDPLESEGGERVESLGAMGGGADDRILVDELRRESPDLGRTGLGAMLHVVSIMTVVEDLTL